MKAIHRASRPSSHSRGFTLLEMILVLGIIASLLGVGVYFMVGVVGEGDETKIQADIQAINTCLIRYKTKARIYPSEAQGLDALVSRPTTAPEPNGWKQLIKERGIIDPYGQKYRYRYPGKHNPDSYDIYSIGPDGQEGTADDIGNW